MFLDSATLHDLEVFSTSAACGPTLVSLVDRTRTRAGRKHLCRHLVAPAAHSAEEILALQRAHQVLAAEAVTYRTIVDRADADGAERYLSSNWQLPHGRSSLERFVLGVLDLLERSAGSSHVPSATPLPPSAAGAHQGAGG
jgi:hypothetical protein